MVKALVMPADKPAYVKNIKDDDEIRDIIGGYFEIIYLGCRVVALVDDDGIVKNLPSNTKLTHLFWDHNPQSRQHGNMFANIVKDGMSAD